MKSKAMIEQIRKMHQLGFSKRGIAKSLGISRNTVDRYLAPHQAGQNQSNPSQGSWADLVDWPSLIKSRKKGVNVKALFEELELNVDYSTFARHLKGRMKEPIKPAVPLDHVAGERTQVDYCDGLFITDRRTGKRTKTQFFCGVLPFSSLTFGEFTMNQKLESFIRSHERMFSYFGGVTPYAVLDNLKSGVKNAHCWDPDLNPTYCDFGNHMGFAGLPARPYTPRDKASVEAAIGAIQRSFFQTYRDHTFYSLDELNRCFRTILDDFNLKVMPDHGVSRRERFEVEAPLLKALPAEPYEILEWKTVKVHPDCCVQIDKAYYSVPFQYCGQSLRAKIGQKLIEIFDGDVNRVACHKKVANHKKSIDEAHMPPASVQQASIQVQRLIKQSSAIGPKMMELVKQQLSGDYPYRHLRRMQGIVRLGKQGYTNEALEYAASRALTYCKYNLAYVRSCADNYEAAKQKTKISGVPRRDPGTIHLHGD